MTTTTYDLPACAHEEAVLIALKAAVDKRLKAAKARTLAALAEAETATGARIGDVPATLPSGEAVAHVVPTRTQQRAVIADNGAFLAWALKVLPDRVNTTVVQTVDEPFAAQLLADVAVHGAPRYVDADGVVYEVPGVQILAGGALGHRVTWSKTGQDAMVRAVSSGALDVRALLAAIEGGDGDDGTGDPETPREAG